VRESTAWNTSSPGQQKPKLARTSHHARRHRQLLRAKGAIFAGYSVLAKSVGVPMELIEQMLIGGSFGKYINVEKAVQIGLLPDLPWSASSSWATPPCAGRTSPC